MRCQSLRESLAYLRVVIIVVSVLVIILALLNFIGGVQAPVH
jgi:hypothetical protein